MSLNLAKELAAMEQMTVGELHDRYVEVFGEQVRSRHRQYLIRRIAWRLQANAEGGLSERALRRANELADDADVRVTPPRAKTSANNRVGRSNVSRVATSDPRLPMVGSHITRKYKGRTITVTVLEGGFEYLGERYKSLSATAAFADFDNLWTSLTPREQARVIQLLINRVTFDAADSTIEVSFHASGIKALGESGVAISDQATDEPVIVPSVEGSTERNVTRTGTAVARDAIVAKAPRRTKEAAA